MNYFWIFPKKNILGYPHFRNPPYVCAKTRRACVTLEVSREAWSSAVLFGSGSWGDQCSNRLEASKVMLIGYQRGFFISIYSYNIYIYIFIYIYIYISYFNDAYVYGHIVRGSSSNREGEYHGADVFFWGPSEVCLERCTTTFVSGQTCNKNIQKQRLEFTEYETVVGTRN
jgi:hypothetical protein